MGRHNGGTTLNQVGSSAFLYIYSGRTLSDSDMSELHSKNVCYDDLSSNLKTGLSIAPVLGEFNGSVNQALVDPVNDITITNNAVTFDDNYFTVECSE